MGFYEVFNMKAARVVCGGRRFLGRMEVGYGELWNSR